MAVRGRPASSTPEDTVEKLASAAGVEVPGDDESRRNRLAGLGPLTGIATGVGAASSPATGSPAVASRVGRHRGDCGDGGCERPDDFLGITDPRSWDAASWISDVVPHLAYGIVTAAVTKRLVA